MSRTKLTQRAHWLIVTHEGGRVEVLTIGSGDDEAVPVFSFEEEAQMFLLLRAGMPGAGWRVREITVGELASILCGPCREVKAVALDPLPEACGWALNGLLSVRREEFVLATQDEEPSIPRRAAAPVHRSASWVPA